MKKKLITTLGIFFLVATLVTAGIVANLDKNIQLTKPQREALVSMNLDSYTTTDYDLGNNFKKRCLTKQNVINTCKTFNVTGLSGVEITTILNSWEKERIARIADVKIIRDAQPEQIEEGSGTTTTTNNK